jgi:hypothetical protein
MDDRADNARHDIADQPKAAACDDLPRRPTGNTLEFFNVLANLPQSLHNSAIVG